MPKKSKSPRKSKGQKAGAVPEADVSAQASALSRKLAAEVKEKKAQFKASSGAGGMDEGKVASAAGSDERKADDKDGDNASAGVGGVVEGADGEDYKDKLIADLRRQLAARNDRTYRPKQGQRTGLPRDAKDRDVIAAKKAQQEENERAAFARRDRSARDDGGGGSDIFSDNDDEVWYGGNDEDDEDGGGDGDDGSGDDLEEFLSNGNSKGHVGSNFCDPISDKDAGRLGRQAMLNPRKVFEAELVRRRLDPVGYAYAETTNPKMKYDRRTEKELFPLARAYDAIREGRGMEALDIIAGRIVALHVAFKFRIGSKPNWELASALEANPNDGMVPREMFTALAKHASRTRRLSEWKKPRAPKSEEDGEE